MPRQIAERLIHELLQIRAELREVVAPIPDSDIDWAPEPSMKSYRQQLHEIGAMQAETAIILTEKRMPSWDECKANVQGDSLPSILASLDGTLNELINQLKLMTDDELRSTFPLDESNAKFFGVAVHVELEELIRFIARHEYYHLGQIVTYRWIQGHNPYEKEVATMGG